MIQDPVRVLVSQSTVDAITEAAIRQGYIPNKLPHWDQIVVTPWPFQAELDTVYTLPDRDHRPGHLRHHTINPAAYVGDYGLPPRASEPSTNATGA
jgi:hypothetical protein